jgi:pSer/pThr/pTyr-binding forkhead associated (FHA) protein
VSNRPLAPSAALGTAGPRRRIWLRFQNQQDFELVPGVTVVGRGDGCQLVLDDPLISRRHACFVVDDRDVVLKDLGSTNGVLVNGVRVEELQVIVPGDHITIGHHDAELCWVPFSAVERDRSLPRPSVRPAADTMVDQRAPGRPIDSWESESTEAARVLEMLAGVAEKAFELGRDADAERILKRPLEMLLERVESSGRIDAREAGEAALLAVRLARATGHANWIDFVFRLFLALGKLLPSSVVDELHIAVRAAPGVSLSDFRRYLELLRGLSQGLGPAERFLVRRLEGLEGVLAS